MERRKPELLAPAGDMERLRAAVDYGADAVYLGGKNFGMRSAPANFSCQELEEGVALCHRRGVKVYVTCNTLPRNQELPEMVPFLKFCQEAGVDGFILSDLGVLALAKEYAPQVERHISTQFGVVNYAAAQACFELGASRVVLAREVPLSEIQEIREKVDPRLELEAFAHGSMCVSFSGRCLLSNYLTGRDANRGQCAQPCRWEYTLVEKERPQREFEIFQEERGTYIFNSNDMRMIQHIPAMMEAGISSLKLEGRAKSAYYVACVTQAYRRAIDFLLGTPGGGAAGLYFGGDREDQPPDVLHRVLLWGRAGGDARSGTVHQELRAGGHLPGPGRRLSAPDPAEQVLRRAGGGYPPAGERAGAGHAGPAEKRGLGAH